MHYDCWVVHQKPLPEDDGVAEGFVYGLLEEWYNDTWDWFQIGGRFGENIPNDSLPIMELPDDAPTPRALVANGVWREMDEGMSDEEWADHVHGILAGLPGYWHVTCVDCHG